jgi:hypothetical protein
MIGIFWFRRDLRLEDNIALYQALNSNLEILPIFIFDHTILEKLEKNDARVSFIYDLLSQIQEKLEKNGKSLAIFYGNPLDIFKKLITENNVSAVFANRDYEPKARERDKEIYYFLQEKNIEFKSFKDQVIFEKAEIIKDNGTPYQVFTPYSKRWIEQAKKLTNIDTALQTIADCKQAIEQYKTTIDKSKLTQMNLERDIKDNLQEIKNIQQIGSFCDKCKRPFPENDVKQNDQRIKDLTQANQVKQEQKEKLPKISDLQQTIREIENIQTQLTSRDEINKQLLDLTDEKKRFIQEITTLKNNLLGFQTGVANQTIVVQQAKDE